MSGEFEGVGDVVTGVLLAKAVEPDAGAGNGSGSACLNCGTALIGAHCHACGQKAVVHRTLAAFWHDLVHAVFHFDGKLFRTLPLLCLKPGELTRRYIHGERAKFVSPLALFLFSVFLMFAVLSILGRHLETPGNMRLNPGGEAARSVAQSKADLQKEVAAIDRKIAAAQSAGKDTRDLQRDRVAASGLLRIVEGGPSVVAENNFKLFGGINTGSPRLDAGIKKANENPNLLLYKLQSNAYKFSWALIPLSVPFVWSLFFWKRRFKIFDHATFVTYSLSFMTLLGIVLTIVGTLPLVGDTPAFAFMIIAPIHIYKQMKGTYELSRASALIRTFILLNMITFVVVFFVLLLLALGVLG